MNENQEIAFEDWVKLLERADRKEEFLTDPKAVWLEAWSQATMIAMLNVDKYASPECKTKLLEQIQSKLLK